MRWNIRLSSAAATAVLILAPAVPALAVTQLVVNGTFSNGTTGWWNSANTTMAVSLGRLRVDVPSGTVNPHDAMLGQSDIPLGWGRSYTFSFDASASRSATIVATVQMANPPYTNVLARTVALTTSTKRFTYTFTSNLTAAAGQVTFQLGNNPSYRFYVDNVSLLDTTPGGANPIAMSSGFYVDPNSNPATWVANNGADPRAPSIQTAVASQPMARWFGNWSGDIATAVGNFVGVADSVDKLPILVAYNIPGRDACGGHSGGGAGTPAAYQTWINAFATAIGSRPAVVVIEPDALADFNCMDSTAIASRNSMLRYATEQFRDLAPNTWAYLDAGNAGWVAATTMAGRLNSAGVTNVRGFAVNVSNYYTTTQSVNYATSVNGSLPGYTKPFVIDTSRNGNGHNGQWCNPPGRMIGSTSQVGGGAEMLLWVKTVGNSDGPCGTEPTAPAGQFVPDLAIRLINGT